MGLPKLWKLRLPRLWGPTTSRANIGLRWSLKQSCSPRQEFFNGMSHTTCTQINRIDSQLSVVWSQTINLTPNVSFGHNLCFRCPNGMRLHFRQLPFNIFQWYKELFNPLGLTLAITLWTFGNPLGFQFPKWEFPWEWEGLFPHTLLHSREHAAWLLGFPLTPQPCNPLPWSWTQG
jgi:hypothetical protein